MKLSVILAFFVLHSGLAATTSASKLKSPRPSPAVKAAPKPSAPKFIPLEPQTWQSGSTAVLQITKPKPLFLKTRLVAEGRTVAAIVASPRYSALAKSLQTQIQTTSGVVVTVLNDAELASEQGLWTTNGLARRGRSLIVLGNLETCRLIPILYARGYTDVDAGFPGKDGYVLQTIHDPWGNGKNVIVAGGSDDDGVKAAVSDLIQTIAKLPAGPDLTLPRLMKVKASQQTLRAVGFPAGAPDEKTIAQSVSLAKAAFAKGQHTGLTRDLVRAASGYSKTGYDAYAELYKRMARAMFEIYRSKPATYGGPWGMDADFNSMNVIAGLDLVEESPAFSDAERLEVTRIIAEYASYVANYGNTRQATNPGIRHNHNTFPCLGTLFAAEYFGKYYQAAEAAKWLENADACFQSQALSFKPQEDANGYQWLTMQHALRYALARPDHKIFTNGNARTVLDLAIGTMDNIGWQSPFGDVGGLRGTDSDMPLLAMGAWFYKDSAYSWALQKGLTDSQKMPGRLEYALASLKLTEPPRFSGTRVFPMSPDFYNHWAPRSAADGFKPWIASLDETYDKITFRDGFDPDKPYLLLDGISTGGHRHYDGNAIIRYSEHSRQWIADGDYIEALPKFHTSVLVYKDGQTATLPPFCALEARADFTTAGMVRSSIRQYSGVDWARNIVWLKGAGFVAIDSLKATEAGDYSFRAVWHTIGRPKIEAQRYSVQQQHKRMVLDNLDGSRLKLTASEHLGRNLRSYTNSEPVVQILEQITSRSLARDQAFHFLNVFSTSDVGAGHPLKAARASDSSMLLSKGAETWLVGVTDSKRSRVADEVVTDASIYILQQGRFLIANGRFLSIGGQTLLDSDIPLSADLDLEKGTAVVECDAPARVTLCGQSQLLKAGTRQLSTPKTAAKPTMVLPSAQPFAAAALPYSEKALALSSQWQFPGEFDHMAVAASDGDSKTQIVASDSNTVVCIGADGKERWRFPAKTAVNALYAGQIGVAAGCTDGTLHMLNKDGQQLWSHAFPYYKRDPVITVIFGADLDGDRKQELVLGTESWHFYALDTSGKQLWQFEFVHDSTCGTAADLDGDFKQEVLAGTRYYHWHAVASSGKKVWSYRTPTGPHATCVAAGDLSGTAAPEIVFGGADGNLHVLNAKGARILNLNIGDEVTDVAIAGKQIYATSTSFNLFAFDGQGRRLWRRERSDAPNTLVLLGSELNPRLAVGYQDGAVAVYSCDGVLRYESRLKGPVASLAVLGRDTAEPVLVALVRGQGLQMLALP